jgi:hypothetical protein
MLAARIGVDGIQIAVHKSPMYGWDANIITVPSQAINAHAMLQQIVAELRERYDLKEWSISPSRTLWTAPKPYNAPQSKSNWK